MMDTTFVDPCRTERTSPTLATTKDHDATGQQEKDEGGYPPVGQGWNFNYDDHSLTGPNRNLTLQCVKTARLVEGNIGHHVERDTRGGHERRDPAGGVVEVVVC